MTTVAPPAKKPSFAKRMSSGFIKRASFSKKSSSDMIKGAAAAKPDELLAQATTEQEMTAAELKAEAPGSAPAPVDPEVNAVAADLVDKAVTDALKETAAATVAVVAAPAVAAVAAVKKAASKVDLQAYQTTAIAKAKAAREASPAKQLLMAAVALLLLYVAWTVLFAAEEVVEVAAEPKGVKLLQAKLQGIKIPEIKIKLPNLKKAAPVEA